MSNESTVTVNSGADQVYNNGGTSGIRDFGNEIMRRAETKRDYILETASKQIMFETDKTLTGDYFLPYIDMMSDADNGGMLPERLYMNDYAIGQLALKMGIPRKYFDRMMRTAPDLLSTNVNHWMDHEPKRIMLRTLDGKVRAILSDRYRPLDNWDILKNIAPILRDKNMQIKQGAITDSRMYLKAVFPELSVDLNPDRRDRITGAKTGDIVQAGIILSNSEVGAGSVKIESFIWRLVCLNGMISGTLMRKFHVGASHDGESEVYEFFKDDTRRANDDAFYLRLRDIVDEALKPETFREQTDRFQEAHGRKIKRSVEDTITAIGDRFSISEQEKKAVMEALFDEGEKSQWGLANAITASAKLQPYDRQVELERVGADIVEMNGDEWQKMAVAL